MRIRAHPDIEQAAMTGLNAEPITAARVFDNIQQVCSIAGAVIAGGSSICSFGGMFSNSATKC